MDVTWHPEDARPSDADDLEAEIRRIAPAATVRITRLGDYWLVRALMPAGLCTRGPGFEGRDASEAVARVLLEGGHDATARRRR